jgi:hypothetical protein
MRVGIPQGLGDFHPTTCLDRGWYKLNIQTIKGYQKPGGNSSLIVNMMIEDGPGQADEFNKDPVGREASAFVTIETTGYSKQYADKIMGTYKSLLVAGGVDLDASDFDPEEALQGKIVMGLNEPRVDKSTGKPRENWTEFKGA